MLLPQNGTFQSNLLTSELIYGTRLFKCTEELGELWNKFDLHHHLVPGSVAEKKGCKLHIFALKTKKCFNYGSTRSCKGEGCSEHLFSFSLRNSFGMLLS